MKRMKRSRAIALLLSGILMGSVALCLAPAAFAARDTEVICIDTIEDFAELAERCTLDTWSHGKRVVLRADLSLSGAEPATIPTFGGTFDGNGHTISGLKITQSMTPNGLFGVLQESAVVKNLKVSGDIALPGDGGNVGGIVGENYGRITGCTFTGSVSGAGNVGGIAGINAATGQILACRTSGSVVGEKMTGGIAGCNLGVVRTCRNGAYVNTVSVDPTLNPGDIRLDFSLDVSRLSSADTGMTSSDTGGIAGYSSGIVSDCVNNAPIGYPHIGYNVGGIVGRSSGYIHACENGANIFGRKDVGGIAGQMEPYIAKNISESTLARLERQLDALDGMLTTALDDANAGVETVTSRLNRIADYLDRAAGAASSIRTHGSVTSTVTGSGETDSGGSVTITPPQAEAGGSAGTAGGVGAVITPGGGAAAGGVVSGGEIQAGLTEGGAEGEHHASASGSLSASAQITMTTNLGGLSSAISGMSGQMRLLNGEITGISGTLTEDVKAIQKQISDISDTAMELFRGDGTGDILIDSSDLDADLVTLGKTSDCSNHGSVNGDINVGGIAGAMAMEYELDPEDDVTSNLDAKQRRSLEVKAIVLNCVSDGKITAKRSYAGGICGRMDLGLIAGSEGYGSVASESGDYVGGIAGLTGSTVRHCFAKCTLSGGKYIGGIVGSGVAEDLSGDSSTVAGCYSMVSIESYQEFAGAISGVDAGSFVENYFISDTLPGMNGRSYTGRAEPISYAELLKTAGAATQSGPAVEPAEATGDPDMMESAGTTETTEGAGDTEAVAGEVPAKTADAAAATEPIGIPDAFLRFTLTFVADGETIKTVPFAYGDTFDETVYPEIPAKEGTFACWDRTELKDLHFDTVVTAVYTPFVSALSNAETRADGRPIFFVEGRFGDEAATDVTALPNTPEDFPFLASGWTDFLAKSFSGRTVSREIVEQWRISIPDDGREMHTVRYLSPDADPEHLDIYVKGANGWQKAQAERIGSYLVFSAEGSEAEIAVISTVDIWWVWLVAGILLLILLWLIVRLLRKLVKAKRGARRAPAVAEPEHRMGEGVEADQPENKPASSPAPERKKRWVMPLLIVLALLVGIGGTASFFLLPDLLDDVKAYALLKEYADKQELTMDLTVDGTLGSKEFDFTAALDRTDVDGRRVTAVSQDGRTLYYCDGTVFLENGNAYKLSKSFPDYSRLLDQAMELYRHVDMDARGETCFITAEGADAKAILELLVPSASALLADTGTMHVELLTDGDAVSEIRFSGSGTLNDSEKTPLDVSAVLTLHPEVRDRTPIPEAVRNAVVSGEYEALEPLSDDLIRVMRAWQALNCADAIGAKLLLKADCGPVTLNDSLDYYRWNCDGTQIAAIRKNGYALYFTDTAICNQNGVVIPAASADTAAVEASKLLDIAYQTCLNAKLDCSQANGMHVYTLSLDEDGMEAVAYTIAPAVEGMDLFLDSGSIRIVICGEQIRSMEVRCGGTVQIVLSHTDVSFEARMEFVEGTDAAAVPEAVRETLGK